MATYKARDVQVEVMRLKNRTTIETKVGTITGEPGQILVTYPQGVSIVCTQSAFRQLFELVGKTETNDDEPTSFQKAMEDIREVKDG